MKGHCYKFAGKNVDIFEKGYSNEEEEKEK
jgi:hypothetical protein